MICKHCKKQIMPCIVPHCPTGYVHVTEGPHQCGDGQHHAELLEEFHFNQSIRCNRCRGLVVYRKEANGEITLFHGPCNKVGDKTPQSAPDTDDLKTLLYAILGQEKLAEMGVNQKSTQAAIAEVRALRHNLHETTPQGMQDLLEELALTKRSVLGAVIERDDAKNRAEQAKSTAEFHKKQAQDVLRKYNQLRSICDKLAAELKRLP